MLRVSKSFADAGGILDVLRWGHEHSVYAKRTFHEAEANRIICSAIQRNGFKSPAGTFVMVSEIDGEIQGFIIGALAPIYNVHVELGASDIFWIAKPKCPVRDRVGLMLGLVDWAKHHPKCVEVNTTVSDAMGGAESAMKILEKIGFERSGSIFRMEFGDTGVSE